MCIYVSQEAGDVVWYSHLLKIFPQFVMIHTVKGFIIVSEAEVVVFLEFLWFFYDPLDVGNLISGSSAFSKSNLYLCMFLVHTLLNVFSKDISDKRLLSKIYKELFKLRWGGKWEGHSGWGTHVNPWLIHISVWQKPLQYCKVISLQQI